MKPGEGHPYKPQQRYMLLTGLDRFHLKPDCCQAPHHTRRFQARA
jgi:hypothetical protein